MSITPVILCGGSGTRLWPLSRKSFPKQFVPLVGNKSLLQLTLERVASLGPQVIAVAADDHRFMVADTMWTAGTPGTVILEPVARNTAAAMALAALQVKPDEYLLFCPADHHIPDAAAFARTVKEGVSAAASGAIVTFGVVPSFPSTAYGYIRQGVLRPDGSKQVSQFIEKPNAEKAQQLLLEGETLWNAGIFLVQAQFLLEALDEHARDILQSCKAAMQAATSEEPGAAAPGVLFVRPRSKDFAACRSQSIDYAVMERHQQVAVLPFRGQWSDVGSWNAVADLATPDAEDNRIHGQGWAHNAQNTFIHAPHRPVVALGTKDLLIIDTPDAVLVAQRDSAEQVKEVVARLEQANTAQASFHRKVVRPWGWYDGAPVGLVRQRGCRRALPGQAHRREARCFAEPAEASPSRRALGGGAWDGAGHARRGDFPAQREPVHVHSHRRSAPAAQPGQDGAGDDRSSVRQLPGRGRHRPSGRQLRPQVVTGAPV
jgi:mannose-1-phosphate guanylyltransferase / mannose-6-phosphate isomerase